MKTAIADTQPRILIADDDETLAHVVHELLAEHYDCVTVSSAEAALERLRGEEFDLLLSDIQMSGISGLELVPRVQEIAPHTIVIMMSGDQTVENAITAMRVGAFDFLVKPFDMRHLEATVQRGLEHAALRKSKAYYEKYLQELVEQRTSELAHLAYYDTVTDLPNRTCFEERLTAALTRAHDVQGTQLAVLLLSLDRFEQIVDTLGHAAADQLIREVAARVQTCGRAGATIARWGGADFAVLCEDIEGAADVMSTMRCIERVFRAPFRSAGDECFLTLSGGVSLSPADGADAVTLLKNAGAALSRTREQGGDDYRFYTAEMNERALKRLALENSLRRALEREEFCIHYQPQVCALTGRLTGIEALVRWQRPELGLVPPSEFIPLAEDTGLIVRIDEWVLRHACLQNRAWQEAGLPAIPVSVNLSIRQFQQPGLVPTIERVLTETKLDARYLEIELTESSVMRDIKSATDKLRALKAMGVKVAVDDFGTGYSSLTYLKHLPIDILKIDQSFVRDMTVDPKDTAIVRAIITLAHSLKLRVKAEGVELPDQQELLRMLGCDELQGYFFGRPQAAEVFARRLREEADALASERPTPIYTDALA
jgi:diguanylate cyclase (GGDEF)-like protein